MNNIISSNRKLGILGGGQLGKMLIQAASRWDIHCCVLDPDPNCASSHLAHEYHPGKFSDFDTVLEFGRKMDVITIEIENVNTEALKRLSKEGKIIHPAPEVIEIIKDKGLQKKFYKEHNIASSDYINVSGKQDLMENINSGSIKIPFVQKLCREGYDGRGVAVIRSTSDYDKILDGDSVIEQMVDIEKEISVVVSRNTKGEINVFPPVEMEFSDEANLVEILISPAGLSSKQVESCINLAKRVIESFDMVGVLAVEMFLTKAGKFLVNEAAPRPHNSGHHTIEANESSQYEQHLRAILDMPLGNVQAHSKAVMINVLGGKGHVGPVKYINADEVMKTSGAHLHIYGKKETKPFRKMGHITICGDDLKDLIERGNYLKNVFKVEAKKADN